MQMEISGIEHRTCTQLRFSSKQWDKQWKEEHFSSIVDGLVAKAFQNHINYREKWVFDVRKRYWNKMNLNSVWIINEKSFVD